jgi:hypothetical protein
MPEGSRFYSTWVPGAPDKSDTLRQGLSTCMGPNWDARFISMNKGKEASLALSGKTLKGTMRLYVIPSPEGTEVHLLMDIKPAGALSSFMLKMFWGKRLEAEAANAVHSVKARVEGGKADDAEEVDSPQAQDRREFLKRLTGK